MEQSRLESLIESVANIVIGYVIAIASQMIIFPWFGIHSSFADHLAIGGFFTIVSLVRSYALRRWFNARLKLAAQSLAGTRPVPARRVAPVIGDSAYSAPMPGSPIHLAEDTQ